MVDDKGVVHYGDRIPAQETQKERSIINREGVEVGRLDAQRSPAQIAEQARRDQEQLRLQQHDNFLMTTYTSAKDIEELRDARLGQLNGQHLAAEQYVQNLKQPLDRITGSGNELQAVQRTPRRPQNARRSCRRTSCGH